MPTKHQSPAKKARSARRMIHYLCSKLTPKCLTLSATHLPHIDISPALKRLSISNQDQISVRPRKIYHPCIINASDSLFKKHPDLLQPDEIVKFNNFRKYKSEIGDPLETNVVFLPIGGLRKCLVCGNLTWTTIYHETKAKSTRVSPSSIFKGVFPLQYCIIVIFAISKSYNGCLAS